MDSANGSLKVKISGKNSLGEQFQEIADMEQFGNFGVLIYTSQSLKLSDRIFISGAKGEPIANAEVVWLRGGDLPAVEALLYRGLEKGESISAEAAAAVKPTEAAAENPAAASLNAAARGAASSAAKPPAGKTGSLGGPRPSSAASSLGKQSKASDENTISDMRTTGTGSSAASSTRRLAREKREESTEIRPAKISAKEAALNRERLATLQQHRKIALTSFAAIFLLFIAALAPVGVTAPTSVDVLEQKDCLEIGSLNKADELEKGDLEAWSQSANGAIQFIRREEISAGDASAELANLQKDGLKLHGCWCRKGEGQISEDAGFGSLPASADAVWKFKPVGMNAENLGDLTLEWKDGKLLYREAAKQSVLERTQDVNKVVYYAGIQKLVIQLNDYTETAVDAPFTKQLTFYLPSGRETLSAAEGKLINSTFQVYMAQSSPKQNGFNINIRQILAIVLGIALLINAVYLAINYRSSRA